MQIVSEPSQIQDNSADWGSLECTFTRDGNFRRFSIACPVKVPNRPARLAMEVVKEDEQKFECMAVVSSWALRRVS